MKNWLITAFLLITAVVSFSQQKNNSLTFFIAPSFPLRQDYSREPGGSIQAVFPNKKNKGDLTIEAYFNHFKNKANFNIGINYIAATLGYKAHLKYNFYLYGGGGTIVETTNASGFTGGGLFINSGLGYKIKFNNNSGIDILPRINVAGGDVFVKHWISISAGYAFNISHDKTAKK